MSAFIPGIKMHIYDDVIYKKKCINKTRHIFIIALFSIFEYYNLK